MRKYIILIFSILPVINSYSQHLDKDSLLYSLYQRNKTPALLGKIHSDSAFFFVKMKDKVSCNILHIQGVKWCRQLSSNSHIVYCKYKDLSQIAADIRWASLANDLWKLAPGLSLDSASYSSHRQNYYVFINDRSAFLDFISSNSAEVKLMEEWPSSNQFRINAPERFFFKEIVPLPYLFFADHANNYPIVEAAISDFNHSFNNINTVHAYFPALNAEGLNVSIKEDRFDSIDIDLLNRSIPYNGSSKSLSIHATAMATMIGGAGNSYYTGLGVAKGAGLSSSDFKIQMPDTGNYYKERNISVQNHSYGVGIENYYGSEAAAYDASMYADTSLVHVFSSGNLGLLSDSIGRYKGLNGFANLTGNFKMSKNAIVVGSLDSSYDVPLLSSRGPAYDGRIKPELIAYGQGGSSGAAALVSGTTLIIQDAYKRTNNNKLPANALVKAILLNSADDILPKGPDFKSGYGLANAARATKEVYDRRFISGSIGDQGIRNFNITVPENAINLKVTLAWTDPPAYPNALTALVNDLDLMVSQKSLGRQWYPWILNSYPQTDSLLQPARQGRDSLNTVEQITIDNPISGSYLIKVTGYSVRSGSQNFYITYQWDTLNTFNWTSPVRTDNFVAGSSNIFKWENRHQTQKGSLEISYDGAHTWNAIKKDLSFDKPYYRWTAPDTFVTKVIARMTIDSKVYITDPFSISNQIYPSTGFNCGDSILLHWPSKSKSTAYRLYSLKDKYLEPYLTVKDTFAVIHNPDRDLPYYAIATIDSNNIEGMKSYAVSYRSQGVSCYFQNFLANFEINSNSAILNLSLGTIYNLRAISFEKKKNNNWHSIRHMPIESQLVYRIADSELTNGFNTYRAVLTDISGNSIYSSVSTINYWKNVDFIFFPNPVKKNQTLNILSKEPFNKLLTIYNSYGQQILKRQLSNTFETIAINSLTKGVYIAVVIDKMGNKLSIEKIIIL